MNRLPKADPNDLNPQNVKLPRVVDCDSGNHRFVIDDQRSGVSWLLFDRYLKGDKDVDLAELCDTPPPRLEYILGVPDDSGLTMTTYCFVNKPIGER